MIYLDNPLASVRWDDLSGAVFVTWKKFASGDELRLVLTTGLDLLAQKKTKRWLSDLRDLGAVTPEDQKWSFEIWLPNAMAAGLARMAFVSPRKVVAQMAVKTFMTKIQGKEVVLMTFDELEKARTWLRAQR